MSEAHHVQLVALQHYEALKARDLEACARLLADDVEMTVGGGSLSGRDAVLAHVSDLLDAFPALQLDRQRVVAQGADTVVTELRLSGALAYQIIRVADGRITAIHTTYAADPADQADLAQVPSRPGELRALDEQAALRRLATLVARGPSEQAVFAAVNQEVARIVGADATSLMRFESDDTITLLAAWGTDDGKLALGERQPLDDALRSLRETGRPQRFGPAELPRAGPFVEDARALGIRASVGVPITVDGRVWGVSFAASRRGEPFPDDTAARIERFTELVAIALSNAQARADLHRLAEEQAALRRVAELVARGVDEREVFAAVADEARRLLNDVAMTLTKFDGDHTLVVVAASGGPAPIGTRIDFAVDTLPDWVLRRGRVARVDDYSRERDAELARRFGLVAAVAAPILVEGQVWGMFTATSGGLPLPAGTENRLQEFAELVGSAIANAENRAQLIASRARVVATGDEARRRLQRDLHDGAQQRLVQTVITLKLIRAQLAGSAGPTPSLVDEALLHAERATADLRDLVRGILPASLSLGGLRAGVQSLIREVPLIVDIDMNVPRLPSTIETAAYFVIAEALANVVKHAEATRAIVRAVVADDVLVVIEVEDDGRGGAEPAGGSGLIGLYDRVEAAEGTLTITSPQGGGTRITATLPIGDPRSPAAGGS